MVYCTHCADYCPSIKDPDKGYICCGTCGKVLDQEVYTDEPTFVKDNKGQSRLAGSILESIESGYSMSRQRTLDKGRDEIRQIVNNLHISGGETIVSKAFRFYELALDRNFTRGRRTTHVAAACLYIACRQSKKAYLLIDFSDHLQISVYVLGAVFLQLCQVLQLAEHPVVQKLVDPSLFIHRFTKHIVSVVHVCEATLTKRLIEFENTDSGSLTIEEFLATADESNEEPVSKHSPKSGEILCKHKDKGFEHFAHGLCEKCYNKFTKLSGGLEGGSDPPAFQRAEKKRLEAAKRAEEAAAAKEAALEESLCDTQNSEVESAMTPRKGLSGDKSSKMGSEGLINDSMPPKDPEEGGENCEGNADPESLSDIDDAEVDGYLHNEEETQYKKIIWEEMNKEYLEEQAAKEALAAELAARGIDPEAGKKKRKRNEGTKSSTPAETPAEATCNMLKRKGLGSKINVGAVDELYKTKDEVGSANNEEEMEFDALFGPDNAAGETVDDGYNYNYGGYDDDGAEGYNGLDDDFDF
ncbi:Cyclin/Brf1-like TBP-binding protein [Zea mays]|uniref:Cyclin/Brf1-like TBP-binding protein n=1 Tax=Zea mays TaxID=4577 RepID=A0A1D6MBH2_MAIZE|nr:Cyclin/Brf1-like TBP-binding protein [Zea mays]